MLVEPWTGEDGQAAFYRQIAHADERFTDEIEPRYAAITEPTHHLGDRGHLDTRDVQYGST